MANETISLILAISEVIGALGIIYGVLKAFVKRTEKTLTNDLKDEIQSLKENSKETKLSLLRIEILSLIANDPTNHDTIYSVFDEYQKLGGNHYIESVIRKWEKSEGIE